MNKKLRKSQRLKTPCGTIPKTKADGADRFKVQALQGLREHPAELAKIIGPHSLTMALSLSLSLTY